MGQPRKIRKKYSTPRHPWQKTRIDEEKNLRKEYGVKNKKEIWKMASMLRGFTTQAKKLAIDTTPQGLRERENLLNKLRAYGLVGSDAPLDAILTLTTRDIMNRRLQTLAHKKGLANTVKQARQFITHKHVTVSGKKVSSPSYLLTLEEEPTIAFANDKLAVQRQDEKVTAAAIKEEKKE